MAAETPNSFKDPYWAQLASATGDKLGLPAGLLPAIVSRGERSNNDQVSESGARTPFQIIPATRKAAIDKWGVDPYLSPENAAEVAGLLLKDSLDRNKGDTKLAVAEYVGGTNRSNWGPVTKAYVQRVTGAPVDDSNAGTAPAAAPAAAAAAPAQSTFDRVSAQMTPAVPAQIASIFDAYKGGRMSPEQATAFESDVNADKVMLPRGAALNAPATPSAQAASDPASNVVAAYNDGRMSPSQSAAFEADVKSGAFVPPAGAQIRVKGTNAGIPDAMATSGPDAPTSLTDKIVGAGEAALTAATGATGGTVGMLGGGASAAADAVRNGTFGTTQGANDIERGMAEGAQALTYAPRTPSGQAQAETLGQGMQALVPVLPLSAETAALSRAAAPIVRAGADVAQATPQAVKGVAATLADRMVSAMPGAEARAARATPTPGTMGSVGAAGVDMAMQRRAAAADLPVPVELTKGQAERTFEQQQFERETAKTPEAGQPLRERFAQQNESVLKNFDAFVDQTGAEATSLRATGAAVDSALQKQFQADKTKVRVAYKDAEKAGEMESPVSTAAVVQAINDARSAESTAPVITAAKNELVRLGGAVVGEDGLLVPAEMTLGRAEQVRKFVNKVTGIDPTNQKFAGDIKRAIDASTEGAGGQLYKAARAERQRLAQNYEDRAVVNKLLTEKRGTSDRAVALEDVFSHTILDGALDDVRNVRRVLQRGGEEGQQAWRELQGQTIQHLKTEATKNVARDIRGNEIVSASGLDRAIKKLDADGKLDFIFGRRGAEQLRTMNSLAKDIYTAPPGSVNTSNTASIVLAALDMALSGSVGLPLPVASGVRILASRIKDRKLAARVNEALSGIKRAPLPPMRAAPRPMTAPASTSRN